MTTTMIDTLKLSKKLADAGMDRKQAEAIAEELKDGLDKSAVTKEQLDAALSKTETKLIGWQIGIAFALLGAIKLLVIH
jgi:hypothetical protein